MNDQKIAQFPRGGPPLGHEQQIHSLNPQEGVDTEHVINLASTRQISRMELRSSNAKYHDRTARQVFRDFISAGRSQIEAHSWNLKQLQGRLSQVVKKKKAHERFIGDTKRKQQGQKEPATRWTQIKFAAAAVLWLISLLNGTFTVSSIMLDSTAFSGATFKTYSVGLGLFLMPSFGCYAIFHLLQKRRRLAQAYLLVLTFMGLGFFFIFGLTWAYAFAVETDNQTLMDLTTIGMGSGGETAEELPWIFAEASWIQLLAQILADACFAGLSKAYMAMLATEYTLFPRQAFQQDPEWVLLDQEERELSRDIGEVEAAKKQAEERLDELEEQQGEYVSAVCALADGLFNREVDKYEQRYAQAQQLEKDAAEHERIWREKQEKLNDFQRQNPGLQKGIPHVPTAQSSS